MADPNGTPAGHPRPEHQIINHKINGCGIALYSKSCVVNAVNNPRWLEITWCNLTNMTSGGFNKLMSWFDLLRCRQTLVDCVGILNACGEILWGSPEFMGCSMEIVTT